MYLEHFGLRDFPFSLAPDPRFLYLSDQHREALAHLLYGVRTEGGFVQLTGEVGTGKTTVCRCFLEQLPPETRAAVIINPNLTAEELLVAICDEFGIVCPVGAASLKDSLDLINAFLLKIHAAGERAVLIVDEAQNLDAPVLEQLRLLTNLETSRHKLLQIILMGQPELRATLDRPDLRQLAQRITARFHLQPLSPGETAAYVQHRLEVAGCNDELFPPEVSVRLHNLSRGVPRLINILCDRALLGAFAQGRHKVDRATLERAAREVGGRRGWAKVTPDRALAAALAVAAVVALTLLLTHVRSPRAPVTAPRSRSPAVGQAPVVTAPAVAAAAKTAVKAPSSGVLRALLEQPEAGREQDAWLWLYRLWGVRAREGEEGCAQALVHGLACFSGDGGLDTLRRLNRPAIVRIVEPQQTPRWLVLERLQGQQATFMAGGAKTAVDVAKLEGYGITEFVLLWRPPAQSRGSLAAGDSSPAVIWLAQKLWAEQGAAGDRPETLFSDALAERVRRFQRSRGLVVDGVAGPETLLLLDADPAPGTPTLAGPL